MKPAKYRMIILIVAVLISSLGAGEATLDVDLSIPDGSGPHPCVVICPGRGYHKDLPLVKDLAARLKEEGLAAVRFNWSFYTNKVQPSMDGSAELTDIDAAIRLAKSIPGVDSTRIYRAGKSLGSVYGYYAFQKHPELKACLLYTPIIPEAGLGPDYYPKLKDETRPVTFILGDGDRDNCPLGYLYGYLADIGKAIPVIVLSGGHSFEINGDYNDPINIQNTKTAIEMGVYWLIRM